MHPRPASLNPPPHLPHQRDRSGPGCLPDEEPTQVIAIVTADDEACDWWMKRGRAQAERRARLVAGLIGGAL